MLTKRISTCVMLTGAIGIAMVMIERHDTPMYCTMLACGSFLVGAGLIALALFEPANKKSGS